MVEFHFFNIEETTLRNLFTGAVCASLLHFHWTSQNRIQKHLVQNHRTNNDAVKIMPELDRLPIATGSEIDQFACGTPPVLGCYVFRARQTFDRILTLSGRPTSRTLMVSHPKVQNAIVVCMQERT